MKVFLFQNNASTNMSKNPSFPKRKLRFSFDFDFDIETHFFSSWVSRISNLRMLIKIKEMGPGKQWKAKIKMLFY